MTNSIFLCYNILCMNQQYEDKEEQFEAAVKRD